MKKITLIAITCLSFAFGAQAQETKYKIGFKVNPNVSWLKPADNSIINEGSKLRFGFGLNFDRMFTDNYAIGTGLNIFTTGGEVTYLKKFNNPDTATQIASINRNYRLQYAEIPLTLKLRTNEVGYFTFWGQFGLGLGVNISAKANEKVNYIYEIDNDNIQVDNPVWGALQTPDKRDYEETDKNVKDDVQLFRTSLIMGLGGEYNLSGSTSLLFGLTFNNGFSNVFKGKGVKRAVGSNTGFTRDGDGNPSEFKLRAHANFVELNIGLLF